MSSSPSYVSLTVSLTVLTMFLAILTLWFAGGLMLVASTLPCGRRVGFSNVTQLKVWMNMSQNSQRRRCMSQASVQHCHIAVCVCQLGVQLWFWPLAIQKTPPDTSVPSSAHEASMRCMWEPEDTLFESTFACPQ